MRATPLTSPAAAFASARSWPPAALDAGIGKMEAALERALPGMPLEPPVPPTP